MVSGCSDVEAPRPAPGFGKGGGKAPPSNPIGSFTAFDQGTYKGEWHWPQGATVVWDETGCLNCTYAWQYFIGEDWQNPAWEERHWPTGTDPITNANLAVDSFCPPSWLLGQTIRIGNHVWQGVPPPPEERSPEHPNHLGHQFKNWTITRLCS